MAMRSPHEPPQKEVESLVLDAARKAGVPIPTGEISGEEPDFRFAARTGCLGIEVSEVLLPASSDGGISPIEQAAFYGDFIRLAQEQFNTEVGIPVRVTVHFGDREAGHIRRNKRAMARSLFRCVGENLPRGTDSVYLHGNTVPEGLGAITITSEPGEWDYSQCAGIVLEGIRSQLGSRIRAKNDLLPKYRSNLPEGAAVWLLLYSRPNVSRSVPVPHGIEQWQFPFEFDRVFWFVILGNEVVDIQRSPRQAVAYAS
jgi:hypothetical protein